MGEVYFDQNDVEQNKTIVLLTCILCIFVPFLFFLPIVACKDSEYGKFYANQCLILFIGYLVSCITAVVVIGGLLGIVVLVFSIMNAVNASNGVKKAIPLVGDKFVIFK
ncbi:MAG: hypothetical protein IJZ72_00145 [Oscillospiraceae bacterium]|nr:hypothetical protein [Oscillospiraceae bacterium]